MTDRAQMNTEMPFRDLVETDADRGILLFDDLLHLAYANSAARALLHDGLGVAPEALLHALRGLRERLDRSEQPVRPGEIFVGADPAKRQRATISVLHRSGQRWFAVRLAPSCSSPDASVRSLQARFPLTLREAQVAVAVSRGLSNLETADSLGITEKTVKNTLMTVFVKCKVRNRVELALQAHELPFGK